MRLTGKDLRGYLGGVALFCGLCGVMMAQNMESGGLPAKTYVAVRSKADPAPPVAPTDIQLKEAGKPAVVTGLSPALKAGKGIELAFVVDDSLRGNVANQFNDIKAFFRTLPEGVDVFVGYMQNGRVVPATQGFTANRETVVQALHIPLGVPGGNASPYFCVSDLVKNWPAKPDGKARLLFMVTNGVDNYTGDNPLNQDSPYVDEAIKDAQKAGVLVYSLYFADQGVGGGRASFSGQGYLAKTSQETGGVSYYQGSFNPVSFAPYLKQFDDEMLRIFELDFMAHKGGLQPIKVTTDIKGIKLGAPEQIFVGEPE